MKVESYRKLVAWQKGMELVTEIYKATQVFPRTEIYGLTSQMRRAAVSIPSNVAEGQGRATKGEFHHFLGNARGSLFELQTQIYAAESLTFMATDVRDTLIAKTDELGRILNGLMKSLQR